MTAEIQIIIDVHDPEIGKEIYSTVKDGLDVTPYSVRILTRATIDKQVNREDIDNFDDLKTWLRGVADAARHFETITAAKPQ